MKVSKETRQQARDLIRASVIDGSPDEEKIRSLVKAIIEKKPRNYLRLLEDYLRLLRLEFDKRSAIVESASELDRAVSDEVVAGLKKKYGPSLTTAFIVKPELLGGMRVRVGSDVWDSSVRNRLERLAQKL